MRIGPGELWHKIESRCGELQGKEVGPSRVTVWQFVIVEEVLSEEIEKAPRGIGAQNQKKNPPRA